MGKSHKTFSPRLTGTSGHTPWNLAEWWLSEFVSDIVQSWHVINIGSSLGAFVVCVCVCACAVKMGSGTTLGVAPQVLSTLF